MDFPRPKIYELIGAGVAGTGVSVGVTLGAPSGVMEPSGILFAIISFSAGGAFVGHHIRQGIQRQAAEMQLRQFLWDADCTLNSSPLEFIRLAAQRVLSARSHRTDAVSITRRDPARWTDELSKVAALVAYALDPEGRNRDIVSGPANWAQYREIAEWVVPLLDSCGIIHNFVWPTETYPAPGRTAEKFDDDPGCPNPGPGDLKLEIKTKKIGVKTDA